MQRQEQERKSINATGSRARSDGRIIMINLSIWTFTEGAMAPSSVGIAASPP